LTFINNKCTFMYNNQTPISENHITQYSQQAETHNL